MGRHAGHAQRAGGEDQVAAIQGQGATSPRPGDDGLRVAVGLAGEVHRVALQHRLVLRSDRELGDGWVGGWGGVGAWRKRNTRHVGLGSSERAVYRLPRYMLLSAHIPIFIVHLHPTHTLRVLLLLSTKPGQKVKPVIAQSHN